MRKAYRLETREEDVNEREGIYSTCVLMADFYGEECGDNFEQHPYPLRDSNAIRSKWLEPGNDKYYFGFESRDQLLRWFPAARRCGDEYGDRIVMAVYHVPDVHYVIGSKQVMFVKSRATHVGDIELAHI